MSSFEIKNFQLQPLNSLKQNSSIGSKVGIEKAEKSSNLLHVWLEKQKKIVTSLKEYDDNEPTCSSQMQNTNNFGFGVNFQADICEVCNRNLQSTNINQKCSECERFFCLQCSKQMISYKEVEQFFWFQNQKQEGIFTCLSCIYKKNENKQVISESCQFQQKQDNPFGSNQIQYGEQQTNRSQFETSSRKLTEECSQIILPKKQYQIKRKISLDHRFRQGLHQTFEKAKRRVKKNFSSGAINWTETGRDSQVKGCSKPIVVNDEDEENILNNSYVISVIEEETHIIVKKQCPCAIM